MPREAERKKAEFKSGIFIILTLAILIFGVLWLRYFAIKPEMTIVAEFSDPGLLNNGLQVYYQGVNVGKLGGLRLSNNYRYAVAYLEIYKKLVLPKNVYAQIRQEGITGQKYISIEYPAQPVSAYLSNGDVISGRPMFGIEQLQAFFEQQVKSGRMERIFANLEQTLINTKQASKKLEKMSTTANAILQANKDEINGFLKNGSEAASNISSISRTTNKFIGEVGGNGTLSTTVKSITTAAGNLSQFFNDSAVKGNAKETLANINGITGNINQILADEETRAGIRTTFSGIGRLLGQPETASGNLTTGAAAPAGIVGTLDNLNSVLQDFDKLINNINCYTGDIYSDVKTNNLIPNASGAFSELRQTFGKAGNVVDKAGGVIDKLGESEVSGDTKSLIVNTIQNANQTLKNADQAAKQLNCLAEGLSEMFSKRFLLLRLFFGKPGSSLEQCQNLKQYAGKTSKTHPCSIHPSASSDCQQKPEPQTEIIKPPCPDYSGLK